jgi:hypothetical protein
MWCIIGQFYAGQAPQGAQEEEDDEEEEDELLRMQKWDQAKQVRRKTVEAQIIYFDDNSHVKSETTIALPENDESVPSRPRSKFKAEVVGVTCVKAEPSSEPQITSEDLRKLQVQDLEGESTSEEEDDDEIEKRRARARARAKAEAVKEEDDEKAVKEEELPFEGKAEEDDKEKEEDYESSDYETDDDDEQSFRPLIKPQFVSKKDRATIVQRAQIEAEEIALEEAKKNRVKERKVFCNSVLLEL